MDKREQGIYGGIGTGAFGIIMGIVALNTGISNLTGQVEGAISGIFILISIAAFARPESMGQIAMEILKNLQRSLSSGGSSSSSEQSNRSENVGGHVVNIQGDHNVVTAPPRSNLENDRTENIRILDLFESEISRIEANLNSVPDITDNGKMVMHAVELWKRGNPQIFQNIPVYSQYQREMTQFSTELQNKVIEFYSFIQTIHRNENFDFHPGSNDKFFQIKAYFDNARFARSLIPAVKELIRQERTR